MAHMGRWLRYVLAAATVILLALMAWQCVDIYIEGTGAAAAGEAVFTRQKVSEKLARFVLPWTAYAVLAAAAAIIGRHDERPVKMTAANRLRLVKARVDVLPAAAVREETLRRVIYACAGAALLVCAAFSLAFMLDGANFVSWDLENVMGRLLRHVGPWVLAAFAIIVAAAYLCDASMGREADALKGSVSGAKRAACAKKFPVNTVRIVILAAAAALIIIGVLNGGMRDVLIKAINICTECIGLG